MGTCIHTWYITSDMESRALADPQAVLVSGVCVRRAHMCFQNWLSIIIGAGRALDMGAYTGADGSVETRTSSYAKAQETPKG